jgi:type I restriction enzyme S subunit
MTERLPGKWTIAPLAELCQKIVDGSHNPPQGEPSGVPMLSARNVNNCRIVFDDFRYISKEAFVTEHARTKISAGDVLLTIVGTIGRAAIVPEATEPFALQRSVAVLKPIALTPQFCMYQLQSPDVQRQLTNQSRGTAQKGVYLRLLGQIELRVAPIPEQRRIVAEIEKQFTRLDAAVVALKRIQVNLKRYRTAILKAACEGRLVPTEAELARREGRFYEPASELLEKTSIEHRSRWEAAQLSKFAAINKEPPKGWKVKYKEYVLPKVASLPILPVGWCWSKLSNLIPADRGSVKTGPFGSLLKKHEHQSDGVPVFGIENIDRMRFLRGSKIHISGKKAKELADYDARPGDVLISRSGTVGEVCVVPAGIGDARISTNLMRIRLARQAMIPEFFGLLFNGHPHVLNQVSELCSGSTRNFLNNYILMALVFPLPPLSEQKRIVSEVERRTSVIEETEAEIQASLNRAARLRQAVLKRAFEGKLVLQDSNDEPASALLERIRAAHTTMYKSAPAAPVRRRKKETTHAA